MRYDLAIIGAGPAGLSASVYASRYKIKNVVIGELGGLVTKAHEIGNWLGTPKITGFEFAQKAADHVKSYETQIISSFAEEIKKEKGIFKIVLKDGKEMEAKAVLLALGTRHRRLGVPGEKEFIGKGISYCATCDGFFYKGKAVAVIGGNDSAVSAAVYLADIAQKVYLVCRKEELRAEKCWVESIKKNPKIEVVYNANVKEIKGRDKVENIILDVSYQNSFALKIDGVFVEIGSEPNTDLAKNLGVKLDSEGYVKIDAEGKTTEEGVWAAGDITTGSNKFKQIITAAAEGAIAANSIQKYLKENSGYKKSTIPIM